ncbi:MAG: hypothetical protein ABIK68_23830 [bacterium]
MKKAIVNSNQKPGFGPKQLLRNRTMLLLSLVIALVLFNPLSLRADKAGYVTDYEGDVLAGDPLLVNAMKTTMYEYVTDDEEIDSVGQWIKKGALNDGEFSDVILPIMKENCTKCHSVSSTMSDAVPEKPLAAYEDVIKYISAGLPAKPSK